MVNYIFREDSKDRWVMYRSKGTWDRYDNPLRYDFRKNMTDKLGLDAGLRLPNDTYEEVETFQGPIDDLLLNIISIANEIYVRFNGENEYEGYRCFPFTPYFDDFGMWIHHGDKNSWVKIYKPIIDEFEQMIGAYNPDSQVVETVLFERMRSFLDKFMYEYQILIPIKTNQDAKAFEDMEELWWKQNKDYIVRKSFLTDEVINHKLEKPSFKLNSIQKRFESLKRQHTPQAYNVKEVFVSACNFYAKLIDLHCEYLFWRVFYTPQEIPINNDEYGPYTYFEELRNRIPSFSPLAGWGDYEKVKNTRDWDSIYGVVNASYLGFSGFISPFSRGIVETIINNVWESFNKDLNTTNKTFMPHYVRNIESQYIKLKQNNLWS